MKFLRTAIAVLVLAMHSSFADMGPISIKKTEVREPVQNAIILFDQGKRRETIILQTKLVSTRNVKGMFFMPLPSEPNVSIAGTGVFSRVTAFAKTNGIRFTLTDLWSLMYMTNGGGSHEDDSREKGISVEFTADMAEHDITVIHIESWDHLKQWLVQFMADKQIPMEFDLDSIEKTVVAYAADDIRYFIFDIIDLAKDERSTNPLVMDFESDKLYYPLRVNALYNGPSDVQLYIFSPSRIPPGRFSRIGFFESEQLDVSSSQARRLWDGFPARRQGSLNLMCCYMPDPRNVYQEFYTKTQYYRKMVLLRDCALARWERDVNLSLMWGESHDPDYIVDPAWSMVRPGLTSDNWLDEYKHNHRLESTGAPPAAVAPEIHP